MKIRLDEVSWKESFVWRCVSVKKRSGQGSVAVVAGESEVDEQPGSAGREARSTTCERLSSRVSRLIGLERLSRLSRVTELPLAGLELS